MYQAIIEKLKAFENKIDEIPEGRKAVLREISEYIAMGFKSDETAQLVYICTHNSRRSHFCQVWSAVAAEFLGLTHRVECYSGGTESTAFHPNAIHALEETGFRISRTEGDNPVHTIFYSNDSAPLTCFSKKYNHPENPAQKFMAVMVCDEADEACPLISGAAKRLSLPYKDPKTGDGKPEEDEVYQNRSLEIGCDMYYAVKIAKQLITKHQNAQ